jgi:hypothetical protein
MAQFKMIYVFVAAVAAGGSYAAVGSLTKSSTPAVSATPLPATPKEQASGVDHASAPVASPEAGESVEGDVLEILDVPRYTYARIGAQGSEGTWIAVPTAKLAVGQHVKLRGGTQMTDFESTSLKRKFASIWFGMLDNGATANGAPGADPHAGPADSRQNGDPHANVAASVEVKKVDRAPGANAMTIAEIIGQRSQVAGKTIRVRGTVVKSNPGILGKTYLHLRDGSGDASTANHDLTVTTLATPNVGDTLILEGTVVLDKDIGSGYKFPTLLEDAKVITP